MTGILSSPDASRPRPLSDLPVEELRGRSTELARRWAIAIILARPLAQMAEVALGELAREGAALCEQVLAALASEPALEDLLAAPQAGGEADAGRRLLAVAGAEDSGTVIVAADALRSVLWQALSEELEEARPGRLAAAADRLGHVCAMLTATALSGQRSRPAVAMHDAAVPAALEPAPDPRAKEPGAPAGIVDERTGDAGLAALARASGPHAGDQIAVRDQRSGDGSPPGPSAWLDAIGGELRRGGEHGPPFAVLLVQAAEREPRLRRSPLDGDLDAALRPLLESAGALTREGRGRYWLVVPGHDRAGGEALAECLTRDAVAAAAARGMSVQVAIGTASFPQDGQDAAALAAHADVGLYAARAAARAAALRPAPGPGSVPPPYLPADPPR